MVEVSIQSVNMRLRRFLILYFVIPKLLAICNFFVHVIVVPIAGVCKFLILHVRQHLCYYGFMRAYYIWMAHGEGSMFGYEYGSLSSRAMKDSLGFRGGWYMMLLVQILRLHINHRVSMNLLMNNLIHMQEYFMISWDKMIKNCIWVVIMHLLYIQQ